MTGHHLYVFLSAEDGVLLTLFPAFFGHQPCLSPFDSTIDINHIRQMSPSSPDPDAGASKPSQAMGTSLISYQHGMIHTENQQSMNRVVARENGLANTIPQMKRQPLMLRHSRATTNGVYNDSFFCNSCWILLLPEIVNMCVARRGETIAKAPATMSVIAITLFPHNPDGPVLTVPQRHLGAFIHLFKLLLPQHYFYRMSKVVTPEDWRCGIDSIQNKLAQCLEKQSPASIAAIAYAEATGPSAADPGAAIGTVLRPFTKLHGRINLIATNIYRKVGCMDLWKEATAVCLAVKEVVDLLEDLLCSALSGTDKLCSAFREGTLAYLTV